MSIKEFRDVDYGKKLKIHHSQYNEDEILNHIISKIGTDKIVKSFVEFGVESGDECNCRLLAESGWSGIMIDGNKPKPPRPEQKFRIKQAFVTLDNCTDLALKTPIFRPDFKTETKTVISKKFGVFSMDMDYNDIYFVNKIMKTGIKPMIIIVEVNKQPDDSIVIYDKNYMWLYMRNGYMGASYKAYKNLLSKFGYMPVYITKEHVNAFFIKKKPNFGFSELSDSDAAEILENSKKNRWTKFITNIPDTFKRTWLSSDFLFKEKNITLLKKISKQVAELKIPESYREAFGQKDYKKSDVSLTEFITEKVKEYPKPEFVVIYRTLIINHFLKEMRKKIEFY